ncbi:nucleotidyltransferase domain-containing protein [Blautia schinkii]|nr:nucleotidyltransferase domain-containing protein [Blautia schinkii]
MEATGISQRVIEEICSLAQKYNVSKVILFGSRARGDYKRTSDIDLAVEGGDFVRFALDVDEETWTLLKYDIIDLNRDIQEELKESIKKEGKILYEKV